MDLHSGARFNRLQGEHSKISKRTFFLRIITASVLSGLCPSVEKRQRSFCLGAHPAVKLSCDHEEHGETSHPHLSRAMPRHIIHILDPENWLNYVKLC